MSRMLPPDNLDEVTPDVQSCVCVSNLSVEKKYFFVMKGNSVNRNEDQKIPPPFFVLTKCYLQLLLLYSFWHCS